MVGETIPGKFLQEYAPGMRTRTFSELFHVAAMYDQRDLLEWISSSTILYYKILCADMCVTAARHSCWNSLMWMKEKECTWDSRVCEEAARKGHLDLLKWALNNGCPCEETVYEAAADGEQFDTLRWLRKSGYPCDANCSRKAAERGYFNVLQWVVDEQLPWDGSTLYEAAREGHEGIVVWAHENGCPADEKLSAGTLEAIISADLRTLRILHRHGCLTQQHEEEVCKRASKYNREEILCKVSVRILSFR
jgi:hypothetical protein